MILFLGNFKLAFDFNGKHVKAAMRLFHFIMEKSASSELHSRLASKNKAGKRLFWTRKTTTLTTFPQLKNYSLQTSETDESIADTKKQIIWSLNHPKNPVTVRKGVDFQKIYWWDVYDDQKLKKPSLKERKWFIKKAWEHNALLKKPQVFTTWLFTLQCFWSYRKKTKDWYLQILPTTRTRTKGSRDSQGAE